MFASILPLLTCSITASPNIFGSITLATASLKFLLSGLNLLSLFSFKELLAFISFLTTPTASLLFCGKDNSMAINCFPNIASLEDLSNSVCKKKLLPSKPVNPFSLSTKKSSCISFSFFPSFFKSSCNSSTLTKDSVISLL